MSLYTEPARLARAFIFPLGRTSGVKDLTVYPLMLDFVRYKCTRCRCVDTIVCIHDVMLVEKFTFECSSCDTTCTIPRYNVVYQFLKKLQCRPHHNWHHVKSQFDRMQMNRIMYES